MCGIAGVAGEVDRDLGRSCVSRMLRELWRRGPDHGRIATWNNVVLGSRRLAIFDPTGAGNQPMVSPDFHVGLVFNGAIYNFPALRAELERCGYAFHSRTDTEVILNGYIEWGMDRLVAKLDGMFAFSLWDDRSRKLFLVRDRLGVKPLVYRRRAGQLYFASTVAALVAGGAVDTHSLDPASVLEYLNYGYVPDAASIYPDVRKVPPGTILEWSGGTLLSRRYWKPSFAATESVGFDEAVEESERLLLAAVEKRLNADVAVGALLSGGIDSGLVCWAARHLGADFTTFTLGVQDPEADETQAARQTAACLGLKNVTAPFSLQAKHIQELVSAYGEPFASSSALGMLRLCARASDSVRVLLTGEGGDEVFLGYPAYLRYETSERLACVLPDGSQGWWQHARTLVSPSGPFRRAVHMMDYATGGVGAIAESQSLLPWYRRNAVLGNRLEGGVRDRHQPPWSIASGRELIQDFQEWHFGNRFIGEYMTKVDGSSMYHSIEARAPFLDVDLWNFADRLDHKVRLRGGETKAIPREIARRRVGLGAARRAKSGFSVPAADWLLREGAPAFEEAFSGSVLDREGWIRDTEVRRAFAAASRAGDAELPFWHLFVLEKWLRGARESQLTREPEEAVAEISCSSR